MILKVIYLGWKKGSEEQNEERKKEIIIPS